MNIQLLSVVSVLTLSVTVFATDPTPQAPPTGSNQVATAPTTTTATKPAPQKTTAKKHRKVIRWAMKAAPATFDERTLPVNVYYNSSTIDIIQNMKLSPDAMENAQHAVPVSDSAYETKLFNHIESPYVPSSVLEKITFKGSVDEDACAKIPCVAIEKDTLTKDKKIVKDGITRAYYIVTGPSEFDPSVKTIARVDIDVNYFGKLLTLLTRGHENEISIYSFETAAKAKPTSMGDIKPFAEVIPAPIEPPASSAYLIGKKVRIVGVHTEAEAKVYWQRVTEFVQSHTRAISPGVGKSPILQCGIKATMQEDHRVFGIDWKSLIHNWGNMDHWIPSRSSVSSSTDAHVQTYLICYSKDGQTVQQVPVKVTEYVKFRLGLVLTLSKENTLSLGFGFANDAMDVLTMHNFVFPVQAKVDLPLFALSSNPLVLSNTQDRDMIGASQPFSASVWKNDWKRANSTLTIGGKIEVEADLSAQN